MGNSPTPKTAATLALLRFETCRRSHVTTAVALVKKLLTIKAEISDLEAKQASSVNAIMKILHDRRAGSGQIH